MVSPKQEMDLNIAVHAPEMKMMSRALSVVFAMESDHLLPLPAVGWLEGEEGRSSLDHATPTAVSRLSEISSEELQGRSHRQQRSRQRTGSSAVCTYTSSF